MSPCLRIFETEYLFAYLISFQSHDLQFCSQTDLFCTYFAPIKSLSPSKTRSDFAWIHCISNTNSDIYVLFSACLDMPLEPQPGGRRLWTGAHNFGTVVTYVCANMKQRSFGICRQSGWEYPMLPINCANYTTPPSTISTIPSTSTSISTTQATTSSTTVSTTSSTTISTTSSTTSATTSSTTVAKTSSTSTSTPYLTSTMNLMTTINAQVEIREWAKHL